MRSQKIRLDQNNNSFKFDLVFQEIEDELEKKLWEIFDREKNRRFSKHYIEK